MYSLTTFNNSNFTFHPSVWITNTGIISILIILSVYLTFSLVYYQIKSQKRRGVKFGSLSPEAKSTIISKYLCILVAAISIVNHLSTFGTLWVEIEAVYNDDDLEEENTVEIVCELITKLDITAVTLGTGFVHLFLWFRQRIFYTHPSLKVLNDKFVVRMLSLAIIGVWLVIYVFGLVSYYILIQYQFNPKTGCLVGESSEKLYPILIVLWITLSSSMQITLLGLFIFPILNGNQNFTRTLRLVRRVKKAFLLAAICLLSDIIAAVISTSLNAEKANTFVVVYNINLVINLLVIILCYDNWRTLIWPWTAQSEKIELNHDH